MHYFIEVIFNEKEMTFIMQRINALKHQQSEYHQKEIHRNVITATNINVNLMKMKSPISDSVYTIHLEFTEASTGMGEEIRDTLKEKYLQQELKSGSMQMEPSALQYSSQVGETEEKGL